jgi:enoyl-CoA hydratase/carnithine racemase/GNAT superfamily N-acetyltransferase
MALIRTERRGPAYLVGLNRPGKHNALDEAMVAELDSALADAARQPCVLIVHSTTPGVFAAGADIAELLERDADAALRAINAGLFDRLEAHRWPTVALVDGPAYGGGCELTLACDLRLASPRARFAQPEPALGILAGAGANWRLPQIVGLALARRMLYTGEVVDADTAAAAGLVDARHPTDDLLDAGLALTSRIADRSWRALELTKLALRLHRPATTTVDLAAQAMLFDGTDKRERMTRFLTERAERRRARDTANPVPAPPTAEPAPARPSGLAPKPLFHVRQLTVDDGLDLAMSPQPGAWQVYDALQPFPPDEGYRAVVDSDDKLMGYCCLGEAARPAGAPADTAVLDLAIGIRPELAGHGWGAELGRAAVEYAKSVAAGRRIRTTVPDWNTVGSHVARQCGFTEVHRVTYDRQPCTVLEHPAIPVPATLS